jgi:hypothetical protein
VKKTDTRRQVVAWLQEAAQWLIVIVLALQLIGSTAQKHRLANVSGDCASCYLAAHLPLHTRPPALAPFTPSTIFICGIGEQPSYVFVAQQSYLIPFSQAPPAEILRA